jgi:hypothetical protein
LERGPRMKCNSLLMDCIILIVALLNVWFGTTSFKGSKVVLGHLQLLYVQAFLPYIDVVFLYYFIDVTQLLSTKKPLLLLLNISADSRVHVLLFFPFNQHFNYSPSRLERCHISDYD